MKNIDNFCWGLTKKFEERRSEFSIIFSEGGRGNYKRSRLKNTFLRKQRKKMKLDTKKNNCLSLRSTTTEKYLEGSTENGITTNKNFTYACDNRITDEKIIAIEKK